MRSPCEISSGVRIEWSFELRSACQQLAGAALDGDPTCIAEVVEALQRDVPEPDGPTEVLLLRESLDLHLVILCGRSIGASMPGSPAARARIRFWQSRFHGQAAWPHRCDSLERWQAEFTTRFERHHPLPPPLQAKRIIQQEFADPLTLRVLSERVGASRTVLSAQFLAMFGETPASHLARLRTRRALLRLRDSDQSSADIAPTVGYQSAAKLHRRVRSYTGLTPADIRRLGTRQFNDLLAARLGAVGPPDYAGGRSAGLPEATDRRTMDRRTSERRVPQARL